MARSRELPDDWERCPIGRAQRGILEPHTDDNQALAARVAGRLGTVPYEGTDQISAEMRVGCRDGDV